MALDTIEERQAEVDWLYNKYFPTKAKTQNKVIHSGVTLLDDQKLIEKACAAANGDKFQRLYSGDTSGYESPSEADLAFCSLLAFWTNGDSTQTDDIFRSSQLMREKWDKTHNGAGDTYGQMTIQKAIDSCTETYEGVQEREAIQSESKKAEKTAGKNSKKKPRGRTLKELKQQYEYGKEIQFVYRKHLPKGMPVIFGGREGSGKTTNALQMGKEIIETHDSGIVVWLATEGAVLDTISKMDAMGIDSDRFVIAQRSDDSFKWEFSRHNDLKELDSLLEGYDEPILAVFIDSIRGMSKFGDNEDAVGKVIHQVNAIVCDKHRAGLVYLDHHKKGSAANLLDKNSGTTAKTSAVRVVYAIKKESKLVATIEPSKVNIFCEIPHLTSIKQGNKIIISTKETLSDSTMTDKAEVWLAEIFSGTEEMFAKTIYDAGEKEGFSSSVIKKAKKNLGCIEVDRVEGNGPWVWKWQN
jgi:hypothetical protein